MTDSERIDKGCDARALPYWFGVTTAVQNDGSSTDVPPERGPELWRGASALSMVSSFVAAVDRSIGVACRLPGNRCLSMVVCATSPFQHPRPNQRLRWNASPVQAASPTESNARSIRQESYFLSTVVLRKHPTGRAPPSIKAAPTDELQPSRRFVVGQSRSSSVVWRFAVLEQ
jgi:hypothetical protein